MNASPLEIRTMSEAELNDVLEWAAAEGWNPGLHDAASFYAADPHGFLIGLLDGEPIASIFAVKYGAGYGYIGGYIVKPAWRGHGYGWALWQAGMARLAGRKVGLDGVVAQQANYAKSGFRLAHRNFRYQGQGTGIALAAGATVPLTAVSVADLCNYDRRYFPEPRLRFLHDWISRDDHIALGVMGQHGLAGYAVARPSRLGYRIGPLFADSSAVAEQLLTAVRARLTPEQLLFIDVPEANPAALALVERHQMQPCFETARMYTQPPMALNMDQLYGLTSLELG